MVTFWPKALGERWGRDGPPQRGANSWDTAMGTGATVQLPREFVDHSGAHGAIGAPGGFPF